MTGAWAAYTNTAPSGEARERLLEVLVVGSHPDQAHLVEEMLADWDRNEHPDVRAMMKELAKSFASAPPAKV